MGAKDEPVTVALTERDIPPRDDGKKFLALMQTVDKGKPKAEDLAELRRILAKYPKLCGLIANVGDYALDKLIKLFTDKPSIREALAARVEQIAGELAGPEPSPLIRLLAEQGALCWLNLYDTQCRWASVHTGESVALTQSEYWDRRLDRAQRRYLRALETLAKARRLPALALQVNIAQPGGQQVNQVNTKGENGH